MKHTTQQMSYEKKAIIDNQALNQKGGNSSDLLVFYVLKAIGYTSSDTILKMLTHFKYSNMKRIDYRRHDELSSE